MFQDDEDRHEAAEIVARERPELLIFCGVVGLLGNIVPIVAIFVAWQVAEHDFVADTISDLARGPHKWIMDVGFYTHAAGLLALAIAAAHAHLGRVAWSFGIFALAFAALNVVMLGLWDEFGKQVPGDTLSIHAQLSFGLGPLFLAGPLLMARGAAGVRPVYGWLFVASAVLWIVFATAFKLAPDWIDGGLEKIAVLFSMMWTIPLSLLFLGRGFDRSDRMTG